jgi:methylglutaconyl-CoA hydratase
VTYVRSERDERHVLRVTIDRDELRNALSAPVVQELTAAFRAAGADDTLRAVVLTGAGRAFSAGADLAALQALAESSLEANAMDAFANDQLFRAISECPHPVVARVNGHAVGGGAALVACADVAVCTADAKLGFAEVQVGIAPAVISTYVVPKIGHSAARWLFLTGERVDAITAQRVGLVHIVVDAADLDDAVERVVASLLTAGTHAQRATKRLVTNTWFEVERDDYVDHARDVAAQVRVSAEARAGIAALVARLGSTSTDAGTSQGGSSGG